MRHLLEALSATLNGAPLLALAGAAGWGLASLLLSPCHLASIPLIMGYVGGRAVPRRAGRRAPPSRSPAASW